jgi:hypothetical protein
VVEIKIPKHDCRQCVHWKGDLEAGSCSNPNRNENIGIENYARILELALKQCLYLKLEAFDLDSAFEAGQQVIHDFPVFELVCPGFCRQGKD